MVLGTKHNGSHIIGYNMFLNFMTGCTPRLKKMFVEELMRYITDTKKMIDTTPCQSTLDTHKK